MATAKQIQTFLNDRYRRRAEQIRSLLLAMEDDKLAFDAIYAELTDPNGKAGWADDRTDGPPHLATANDMLAFNTVETALVDFLRGTLSADRIKEASNQMPVVRRLCVTPLPGSNA